MVQVRPAEDHDKSASPEDIHFTEPGVRKLLERLDSSKACGPDMLQARVLKELTTSIAPALTEIFNISYRSGMATGVMPMYHLLLKKGKKILAANYRPHHGPCCSAQHTVPTTARVQKHALMWNTNCRVSAWPDEQLPHWPPNWRAGNGLQ